MTNMALDVVRCEPAHGRSRGNTLAQIAGLRYERRVYKQLRRLLELGHISGVEYNPWFKLVLERGFQICSPDFILWLGTGEAVVVEVKLTWVAEAEAKLKRVYLPVVKAATGANVRGLVLCRNAAKASPPAAYSVTDALMKSPSLLLWPDSGPIQW